MFKKFKKATKNVNKHICFVVVKWSEIEKTAKLQNYCVVKSVAGVQNGVAAQMLKKFQKSTS